MAKRITAASGPELVLDATSSPKLRTAKDSDISEAQVETFFDTLAETCNVTRSAEAAGFAISTAYRKRKTDAAFRRAWAEAVPEAVRARRKAASLLVIVLSERCWGLGAGAPGRASLAGFGLRRRKKRGRSPCPRTAPEP